VKYSGKAEHERKASRGEGFFRLRCMREEEEVATNFMSMLVLVLGCRSSSDCVGDSIADGGGGDAGSGFIARIETSPEYGRFD
jgi:hypothetical protein